MGEAVALLSALSGIYNTIDGVNTRNQANQQYQQAMNKPSMSYEQALQRAGDMLNPLYDTQLKQNLSNVDNHNMQRGFYGQLAGDALRNNRATEVETQRVGQTASLANQMMGQDQQSMMSQQQLAAQYAANMGQIGVGQANAGMNQLYQVGKDQGDAIVLQGKNALKWLGGLMGGGGSALDSPASTGVQPSNPSSFDASQYENKANTLWGNPFGH